MKTHCDQMALIVMSDLLNLSQTKLRRTVASELTEKVRGADEDSATRQKTALH